MMSNRILATTVSALAMISISAFAVDLSDVEKAVPLKDGSTVYIFKGGKMGMENKYGPAVRMDPGVVMETKDGQRVVMIGDEVSYVKSLVDRESRK